MIPSFIYHARNQFIYDYPRSRKLIHQIALTFWFTDLSHDIKGLGNDEGDIVNYFCRKNPVNTIHLF